MPLRKRRGIGGFNKNRGMFGSSRNQLNLKDRQRELQRKRERDRKRRERDQRRREQNLRKRREKAEQRRNDSIRKAREKHKNFADKQKRSQTPRKPLTRTERNISELKYKQELQNNKIKNNRNSIHQLKNKTNFSSSTEKSIRLREKQNNRIQTKMGIYKLKESYANSHETLRKQSSDLTRSIQIEEKLLKAELGHGRVSPVEHARRRTEILKLKKQRQQLYFNQEKQKKLHKQQLVIQKQKLIIANLEEQKAKLNKKLFISPANKKARMDELNNLIENHNYKLKNLEKKQENWMKRNKINEDLLDKKLEMYEMKQKVNVRKEEEIHSYGIKIKNAATADERQSYIEERDKKLEKMEQSKKQLELQYKKYAKEKGKLSTNLKQNSAASSVTNDNVSDFQQKKIAEHEQRENQKKEQQQIKQEEKILRYQLEAEEKKVQWEEQYQEKQEKNMQYYEEKQKHYQEVADEKKRFQENKTMAELEQERQSIFSKDEFTEDDLSRLAEIENEMSSVS